MPTSVIVPKHVTLLPWLLQFKADPNIQNANGERPYDCTRLDAIRRCVITVMCFYI